MQAAFFYKMGVFIDPLKEFLQAEAASGRGLRARG